MEIPEKYKARLGHEIKLELEQAIEQASDIRAVLAKRRQTQLVKRYHKLSFAESRFFDVVDVGIDWNHISPQLQWCESGAERAIWDYARNVVSSMPENSVIGRQMRYYFIDENSGRWLGIGCLASALTLLTPRHQHLKWDSETRFKNLGKILNIAVCIPIQPFGLLCGGKLLFVSSLSNEVRVRYGDKYHDELLAVETTSLYGKSSQYNRVKEFKYLGLTKGTGNIHVSEELWEKMKQWLFLNPECDIVGSSSVKLRRIGVVARGVGLGKAGNEHKQRRGYYWGITATNSEEILRGNDDSEPQFFNRPLSELVDFWYNRWYLMRLPKKREEIENFDLEMYRLDNNVPNGPMRDRQLTLL